MYNRALAQQYQDLAFIAKDDAQLDAYDTSVFALFDHLQLLSVRLGLSAGGRLSHALVLRNNPIHLHHRVIGTAPVIRDRRRWGIWMTTPF